MLRNSAKSNWTLDELGWTMVPPGSISEWDGLMGWFLEFLENQQTHQKDAYLNRWFRAGRAERSRIKRGVEIVLPHGQ